MYTFDTLINLLSKAESDGNLNAEEIETLLSIESQEGMDALFKAADRVREKYVGPEVHLRGLVEISNICRKTCSYCGLRSPNRRVRRYRLTPDQVVETAKLLDSKGFRTIVMQSGEDPHFHAEMVADMVRKIKAETSLAITLSLGERPREEYELWKAAGADRYLLRHETTNDNLYDLMATGSSLKQRMECIKTLREIGFQVGVGFMVGLPGQTMKDLVNDLLFVRDFQPDMLGIGPFIPNPDTPLADNPQGTLEMTLKCVAVGRILTRDSLIPATTAIGTIDELGREKALMAGANVVMPNWTPDEHRPDYAIYPNKRCVTEDAIKCQGCLHARIIGIGRTVSKERGDSPKINTAPTAHR